MVTLTIGSDGSYKYVANDDSGLDAGDTVTDVFTYIEVTELQQLLSQLLV